MNIQYVIIIEGSLILSYNFIKQCLLSEVFAGLDTSLDHSIRGERRKPETIAKINATKDKSFGTVEETESLF